MDQLTLLRLGDALHKRTGETLNSGEEVEPG